MESLNMNLLTSLLESCKLYLICLLSFFLSEHVSSAVTAKSPENDGILLRLHTTEIAHSCCL